MSVLASSKRRSATKSQTQEQGCEHDQHHQQQQEQQQQQTADVHIPQGPYFFYRDFSELPDPDPSKPLTAPGRIPNFPAKMMAILSRPDLAHIISWMPHGRSWKVHKPREFEVKVVPTYFEHSKFSSFIRQANGWGFRRMVGKGPDRNAYYHEMFLRGTSHLIKLMKRPTVTTRPPSDANTEPDFYKIAEEKPLPESKVESPEFHDSFVSNNLKKKRQMQKQQQQQATATTSSASPSLPPHIPSPTHSSTPSGLMMDPSTVSNSEPFTVFEYKPMYPYESSGRPISPAPGQVQGVSGNVVVAKHQDQPFFEETLSFPPGPMPTLAPVPTPAPGYHTSNHHMMGPNVRGGRTNYNLNHQYNPRHLHGHSNAWTDNGLEPQELPRDFEDPFVGGLSPVDFW